MQITPGSGFAPSPAAPSAQALLVVIGPAAAAAPIQPERRVTATRPAGRADLMPQSAQPSALRRGRLVDLVV